MTVPVCQIARLEYELAAAKTQVCGRNRHACRLNAQHAKLDFTVGVQLETVSRHSSSMRPTSDILPPVTPVFSRSGPVQNAEQTTRGPATGPYSTIDDINQLPRADSAAHSRLGIGTSTAPTNAPDTAYPADSEQPAPDDDLVNKAEQG